MSHLSSPTGKVPHLLSGAGIGHKLVARVLETVFLLQALHGFVPLIQQSVPQVLLIHQAPLPPAHTLKQLRTWTDSLQSVYRVYCEGMRASALPTQGFHILRRCLIEDLTIQMGPDPHRGCRWHISNMHYST